MEVTRRQFFQAGAATGVAVAWGSFGFDLSPAYAETTQLKISRATEVRTICPYCAVGCSMIAYKVGDKALNVAPTLVHIEGDPDSPVNGGTLCPKGASTLQLALNQNRELRPKVRRPGATGCNIWTTAGFPANNDGAEDGSLREVGTTLRDGTVFRVVEFAPGVSPRNHRTDSIDYAVVMSGEIDMELDGETVHLKAGDVLVQRGTIHNWVNRGREPCMIAFVLVSAKPVTASGKTLHAEG